MTVAMIYALNKLPVPKEWYHDPSIRNKNK